MVAACRQLIPELPKALLHTDCVQRICSGERTMIAVLAALLCKCVDGRVTLNTWDHLQTAHQPPMGAQYAQLPPQKGNMPVVKWVRAMVHAVTRDRSRSNFMDLSNEASITDAFGDGVLLCFVVQR